MGITIIRVMYGKIKSFLFDTKKVHINSEEMDMVLDLEFETPFGTAYHTVHQNEIHEMETTAWPPGTTWTDDERKAFLLKVKNEMQK